MAKNKKYKEIDDEEILDDIENFEEPLDDEEREDDIIDFNIDDIDVDNCEVEELSFIEDGLEFDEMFKSRINKHKLEGTHALKRDIIFMGKEEEQIDETESLSSFIDLQNENFEIEKGSDYELESRYFEDYYYKKELAKEVYEILNKNTDINFLANRRKPNKEIFNEYYSMCLKKLDKKYSKSEIFVELSYYFSDNIFNMFKLLNKKNATGIILELKEKGYLTDIGNINFI